MWREARKDTGVPNCSEKRSHPQPHIASTPAVYWPHLSWYDPLKHAIWNYANSLAVAAPWSLCLVCLGPQIDALSLLAWPQVPRPSLVQGKFLCNGGEEFPHVLARLRRGLKEQEAGLAGVLLGIGLGDGALVGGFGDEIELVTGEGDDDVFVGLALELLYPGLCFI